MTLDRLRPQADRALAPFVSVAVRLGLSPDGVSVIAFLFAVIAGVTFALAGHRPPLGDGEPLLYLAGALLVVGNGWLDLLDGALARELETATPTGDLLDHVLDRYADLLVVAGLAAGVSRYALGLWAVTGVFLTSYLGTQAQAVGLDRAYGGLVGRADRLAVVGTVAAIAAVLPGRIAGLTVIGWLLVGLGAVGHLTALQRFYHALRDLS